MIQVKDFFFGIAQTAVWVVAIVIGAWLFLTPNKEFPRPEISHEIHSACVDSKNRWVRAIVKVRNVGPDAFRLSEHDLDVYEIIPLDKNLAEALLDSVETEIYIRSFEARQFTHTGSPPNSTDDILIPNESHSQHVDFLIPSDAKVIEVTSEVEVIRVTKFYENVMLRKDDKIASGQAKTIYDIGNATCP